MRTLVKSLCLSVLLPGLGWIPLAVGRGDSGIAQAVGLASNLQHGRVIYRGCATCHAAEGWGEKDGSFPQLAGQHRSTLIKQLVDIRSLQRDNPIMHPFTRPEVIGGVQALADVSGYITNLPMTPDYGKGPWATGTAEFERGRLLYRQNCVKCHGTLGEGSAEKFYPRIQGQHYNYMVRQMEWIRDGRRRNADPEMVRQIRGFDNEMVQMVTNYVSRIPLPGGDLAPSVD